MAPGGIAGTANWGPLALGLWVPLDRSGPIVEIRIEYECIGDVSGGTLGRNPRWGLGQTYKIRTEEEMESLYENV